MTSLLLSPGKSTKTLVVGSLHISTTVTLTNRPTPRRRDVRTWSPRQTTSRRWIPECPFSLTPRKTYRRCRTTSRVTSLVQEGRGQTSVIPVITTLRLLSSRLPTDTLKEGSLYISTVTVLFRPPPSYQPRPPGPVIRDRSLIIPGPWVYLLSDR